MTDIRARALALHDAYVAGELSEIQRLLGNLPRFPNCHQPHEFACGDWPLEYALYWSPGAMIRELIAIGADVNYVDDTGFPALFAALGRDKADKYELLEYLIESGADIHQRGINDWTALHAAVAAQDLKAVELLLQRGADPDIKTRIDECLSAYEEAINSNFMTAVVAMKNRGAGNG